MMRVMLSLGVNGGFAESRELTTTEFAVLDMMAFDRLGPIAREAMRSSRFGGSAANIEQRWGGRFADDEAVARRIRAEDDRFSGRFGPPAAAGI